MLLHVRLSISMLFVLLIYCKQAQAQQINVTSVTPNPLCAATEITATYSYTLPDPGTIILYLNGPNTTNLQIGSATTNGGNGSVSGIIPADRLAGFYTVFIRRTSNILPTPINSPASSAFTVQARPTAPTVSNVDYCLGATGIPDLTATTISGTEPKWYTASNGGPAFSSVTPSVSTAGSTTYYVSQRMTVTGCESPRVPQIVTINTPSAKPTVVASLSYCQNTSPPSLAAAVTSGSNLKWYTSASGGTGNTSAPVPSTTTAGPTIYYVSQTSGTNCESERVPITVTIKAQPEQPLIVLSTNLVCTDAPDITLTATPSAGTFSGTGVTGNLFDPGFGSQTVTYTYTAANGCFVSAVTLITVNPQPVVITRPANANYCNGASVTAKTLNSAPANGQFLITGGSAIGLADQIVTSAVPPFVATNTTDNVLTATITITPTANGCTGIPVTYNITVNPAPNMLALPANQTVSLSAATTAVNFTGTVDGTAFFWSNNNTSTGLAASGSGTNNIPAFVTTGTGTSTITVTPTAGGCVGAPASFAITVYGKTPDLRPYLLVENPGFTSSQTTSNISVRIRNMTPGTVATEPVTIRIYKPVAQSSLVLSSGSAADWTISTAESGTHFILTSNVDISAGTTGYNIEGVLTILPAAPAGKYSFNAFIPTAAAGEAVADNINNDVTSIIYKN